MSNSPVDLALLSQLLASAFTEQALAECAQPLRLSAHQHLVLTIPCKGVCRHTLSVPLIISFLMVLQTRASLSLSDEADAGWPI